MMTRSLVLAAAAAALLVHPLTAQLPGPRLTVEPYLGYGFFGTLPDNQRLEAGIAYGGRVSYQFGAQWSLFGNYQRSHVEQQQLAGGIFTAVADRLVDHWAAGVEFSYVPRGGAEGMMPLILEAGLGQARYDWGPEAANLAVKLGLSSAIQFSPSLGVRYGVDDYISNYRGDRGVVNQIFARAGIEISF
jgi:hypothetical protein